MLTSETVIDKERHTLLRGLGPDDGWGLLPAVVNVFLDDCPVILATMRHAIATGDAQSLKESAHQLKGAAGNIGAVTVTAQCQQIEDAAAGSAAPGTDLLDELETELDRAVRLLSQILSAAP